MEIEGMIIRDLGLQEGVSKAGNPWKKHEWVLETTGNYPRKVKFHVFGEKATTLTFEQGKTYVIQFDLESREFNERWYTDVSAYAARQVENGMPGQMGAPGTAFPPAGGPAPVYSQPAAPAPAAEPAPSQNPFQNSQVDFAAGDSTEDLPF